MLGDAARLVRRHVGGAQRVEQRGLAVVDVAHDGDHGRPRQQRLGRIDGFGEAGLDVALGDALGPVAHLGHDQLGGVGIDRLVDGRHHAHAHQRLDDVGAALGHALGELLDRDGLGNRDLAIDLLLRRVVGVLAAAVALQAATHLRRRPAAEIVLALDRAADIDLAGAALGHLAARARRLRQALVDDGGPHRRPAQRGFGRPCRRRERPADGESAPPARPAPPRGSAGVDLLGLAGDRRLRRGGGRLIEALLHQRVGLALDLFLGLLARLFLGQALLVLLVGLLARLVLDGAAGGFLGGALARHLGVAIGVDQGAGARFLLFLGQRLQHGAAAGAGAVAGRSDAAGWRASARRRSTTAQLEGTAARRRRRLGLDGGRGWRRPRRRRARAGGRLTGFLTSTVTARVRPCRTSGAPAWRRSPPFAAAPVRAVVESVSGLVGLVCFVLFRHIVVLSLVRSGPSTGCCSIDSRASAPLRPQFVQ